MSPPADPDALARRHLALGWGGLAAFVALGAGLEAMLAWKVGSYVDPAGETRRTVFRLAHAHGTGISVLQIAYGLTVGRLPATADALTSACLVAALALVPLGFFFGGFGVVGGDPGPAIFAVPAGAVALAVASFRVARATRA